MTIESPRLTLESAVQKLKEADLLLICAGAGMSADSGIPTFRSENGLWGDLPQLRHLPASKRGISTLSSHRLFQDDPRFAWGFFGWRLQMVREILPHSGYTDLLKIAKALPDYFVVTSNVDGHFQKAGYDDHHIQEVHGSLHWMQGMDGVGCWSADDFIPQIDMETMTHTGPLPMSIKRPDMMARPNVWMLEDYCWNSTRRQLSDIYRSKAMENHVEKIAVVSIGAGQAISTIYNLAMHKGADFLHIRIDPDERPVQGILDYPNFHQMTIGAKDGLNTLADAFFKE
jgi:NAD-dependent SIR2 family protein deacetylase